MKYMEKNFLVNHEKINQTFGVALESILCNKAIAYTDAPGVYAFETLATAATTTTTEIRPKPTSVSRHPHPHTHTPVDLQIENIIDIAMRVHIDIYTIY